MNPKTSSVVRRVWVWVSRLWLAMMLAVGSEVILGWPVPAAVYVAVFVLLLLILVLAAIRVASSQGGLGAGHVL